MQDEPAIEQPWNHVGDRGDLLTLSEMQTVQASFDETNFTGADNGDRLEKRRHVAFHVGILAGKLMRIEEQQDHGRTDDATLLREVVPDLLVYAAQLANLSQADLQELYFKRLEQVAERNRRQSGSDEGTSRERPSAQRIARRP